MTFSETFLHMTTFISLHIKLNVIYLTVWKAFIALIYDKTLVEVECIARCRPFQRDAREEQYKYTFGQNFSTIFIHKYISSITIFQRE